MNNYGLLGKKLGHSYSSLIHNYVFDKLGLDAKYELYESEDLASFVEYAKANLKGFNVTIPYKEQILPYLDYIDEQAKRLKNVNTVKIIDNKLYGYNTDSYGFLAMLDTYNIDYKDKKIYILGTGGAAKTVKYSLEEYSKDIYLVSRTKKEDAITYDELIDKDIDIIVNCTPVGMYPNNLDCPVNDEILKKDFEVVDLIYNPYITKLLESKKSTNNGLIMLILQAIRADEIWFNINIDKKVVGDLVEYLRKHI